MFNHFPAPLLRVEFVFADGWRLNNVRPFGASEIPDEEKSFAVERARKYFERPRDVTPPSSYRFDLAILVNQGEVDSPSDDVAIGRFIRAARSLGMDATVIAKDDFGRLAEYDALFIRETTSVNHHTYRFARRAEAEDLVVIDSPSSIVRCSNKVYMAELFAHHGIPCPPTLIVNRDNTGEIATKLGFPCVLKKPDSSVSRGVVKASSQAELDIHLEALFATSELIVAQGFVPSQFDWRIGVIDGKPLYACRYFMARGHWQVQKALNEKRRLCGRVETIAITDAPPEAVDIATRASALIGDGFYGVDIKEVDDRFMVMEVNDNPSIEGGVEDLVLKDDLYHAVMKVFLERLERRGERRA
jgi:glutathione synthase/RimK-type ligase-like ATP-grasp enzyme